MSNVVAFKSQDELHFEELIEEVVDSLMGEDTDLVLNVLANVAASCIADHAGNYPEESNMRELLRGFCVEVRALAKLMIAEDKAERATAP